MEPRPLSLLLIGLLPACTTVVEANGGPTVALPTREHASVGGQLALHGAVGATTRDSHATLAVDPNVKLEATKDTQDIAFGSGFLYMRPVTSHEVGLLRAGLHLAFERFEEKLIMGGGPYASLGFAFTMADDDHVEPGFFGDTIRVRDRTLLVIGPTAEMDARFSRPSAVVFVGLSVGIAWSSENLGGVARQPLPSMPPPPPLNRAW